jgi:hypothetical protein
MVDLFNQIANNDYRLYNSLIQKGQKPDLFLTNEPIQVNIIIVEFFYS